MDMYAISWNEAFLVLLRAFSSKFLTLISGRRIFGERTYLTFTMYYLHRLLKEN